MAGYFCAFALMRETTTHAKVRSTRKKGSKVLKKFIGPAVFVAALAGALALTRVYYYTPPAPPAHEPPPARVAEEAEEVAPYFKPRFVTLDFATRKGHMTLELERDRSRPAPDFLWVWAYFFTPGGGRYCAGEPVEVRRPFAAGDRVTVNVEAALGDCAAPREPSQTFYARVNVSAESAFAARLAEPRVSYNITSATPVVVQNAPRR